MVKKIKNYGRSVKERLLNISRAEKYSSQLLISRYFQERLLYRLSVSDYKEFQDKKSGNVSLIRNELHERYKAKKDRPLIAAAFEKSNKSDQQWVKNRIKEENEGVAGKDYVWVKKYIK